MIALKVLDPEFGVVLGKERFLTEIRITANLHRPHLLPLYDSGEADGQVFYVMPFVDGESLAARATSAAPRGRRSLMRANLACARPRQRHCHPARARASVGIYSPPTADPLVPSTTHANTSPARTTPLRRCETPK
jgi:hypothetical protein